MWRDVPVSLLTRLWCDETGLIVSAELVVVGTLVVIGLLVGLNSIASSIQGEMAEVSGALRGLDQSYATSGFVSCRAFTAGSSYVQKDMIDADREKCDEAIRNFEDFSKQVKEWKRSLRSSHNDDDSFGGGGN